MHCFDSKKSLYDLIFNKTLWPVLLVLFNMQFIWHSALFVTPALGQILDPLKYVDPLIGSSNGGR